VAEAVLVVEDEESISDALSYLMRKEGFAVAVCPTGPGALEAFDRDGAGLVPLDLMLPGPADTEVCRSLRQRSDAPVIMLTAKDTEVDRAAGLGLGADGYATKPLTCHELLADPGRAPQPAAAHGPAGGSWRADYPPFTHQGG
jgi:two-component system, OmpR family, response regulator RegX3